MNVPVVLVFDSFFLHIPEPVDLRREIKPGGSDILGGETAMPRWTRETEAVFEDKPDENRPLALAVPEVMGIVLDLGVVGKFTLVRTWPDPTEFEKGRGEVASTAGM